MLQSRPPRSTRAARQAADTGPRPSCAPARAPRTCARTRSSSPCSFLFAPRCALFLHSEEKKVREHPELNQGPLDLQSNALPLSYIPSEDPEKRVKYKLTNKVRRRLNAVICSSQSTICLSLSSALSWAMRIVVIVWSSSSSSFATFKIESKCCFF